MVTDTDSVGVRPEHEGGLVASVPHHQLRHGGPAPLVPGDADLSPVAQHRGGVLGRVPGRGQPESQEDAAGVPGLQSQPRHPLLHPQRAHGGETGDTRQSCQRAWTRLLLGPFPC